MAAQTIALAGNPNVGKSTIFNALTGSRQHVGNWPGKTVEKKEGKLRLNGQDVVVVDLPGTYSLTAYSIEEIISRDFIVEERPGVVVAVVDAANLERNLYLVTQLLELNVPLALVLNMCDLARERGIKIDSAALSHNLGGVPVIETVGHDGSGIDALKDTITQLTREQAERAHMHITYDDAVEAELAPLEARICENDVLTLRYNPRWLALKLLEEDENIRTRLQEGGFTGVLAAADAALARIINATDEDAEILISDRRYTLIGEVIEGAMVRPENPAVTRSEQIDRVLTHRVVGVPIFLLLMWVVFQFTANVSAPYIDWMDGVITGPIANWLSAILVTVGLGSTWVESLVIDGIIAGVGGVLVFVPVLMSLYFAIGLLEDSGYMARAAFVMDRVMRAIGLHGKSFLPMLVGFGCTVPAVYATRTLENEEDRKLTGFLVTFMSCGARLPVYVVIGTVFFGVHSGNLVFGMYMVGIAVALLTALVFKYTVYRNKPPQPFVMELPPYRTPRLKDVLRQMWERTSSFIHNATTIILAVSVVIWFLMAMPATRDGRFNDVPPEQSWFGTASRTIAPAFAPAGFGDWEAAGSLISGFVAKEVVIGTMNQVFAGVTPEESGDPPTFAEDVTMIGTSFLEATALTVQEVVNIVPRTINLMPLANVPEVAFFGVGGEEDTSSLEAALTQVFSPLAAVAFTVFVLLYTPCMTTVTAMKDEFGWRWTTYQILYTAGVAWLVAVLVYQGGTLLGFGG